MTLLDATRRAIVEALALHAGSIDAAANHLEIGRTTLYRKIAELEIRPSEYGRTEAELPRRRARVRIPASRAA